MEFNGTKGKWIHIEINTPKGYFQRVTIEGGESICNVTTRNEQRSIANARLISKAPEMLEMLKCLIRVERIEPDLYHDVRNLIKEATEFKNK